MVNTHQDLSMAKVEAGGMRFPAEKSGMDIPAEEKTGRNKYATACAILGSMISVLLGYDIGVMSGAMIFIESYLKINDVQIEILAGILNIAAVIGSLLAGKTSDLIGRRYTIVVASSIFIVGAVLMGSAPSYGVLLTGRCIAGIGVGFALLIAPVYGAEISPATTRGFLTSLPELFISTGICLGYVSNFVFARLPENLNWRLMLGIGGIPAAFLIIAILFMPESPRWLVMQGRLSEAKEVLAKVSNSQAEADSRLSDIKLAAGISSDSIDDTPQNRAGVGVWKELLRPTPALRRVIMLTVGIHFFQHATGIDGVVLYSPRIFKKAGVTNKNHLLGATCGIGVTKICFILVATFLLDRVGRRPLLLISVGGMIVWLTTLGVALTMVDHTHSHWAVVLCISALMFHVAFYSTGMGPITWVYSSEIWPLRLRAQGASLGVAVNRVMGSVISMTFISLYKSITIGGVFFLFAGIAVVAWLFFFTLLPETKGKTLEELEVFFGNKKNLSVEKVESNKEIGL